MSDSIANGGGCRPCRKVQLDVTDAILHFVGDGSALSHLNASNVDFGTLRTSVFPVSGVTAGTYGSSSNVSQVTVDQYGRVIFAQNVAVTSSQWTGQPGSSIYYIPGVSIGSSNDATANLQVTGNVYVSNAITTTNVFATRYYGDGGFLSNITSFIQPLANLVVSNSVTTTNVFATAYYGDGGLLSNISSSAITQPFANLVVSNSVTTTNVFASGTSNLTNVNVQDTFNVNGSMTANAANATFFFDTFTIPYINTQYMNVASNISFTGSLATFSNLYVPGNANIEYLSVSNLAVTGNLYVTATNVQTTNALTINNSGTMTAFKVTQNETSIHTHNVAEFWDATTLAMVIDPEGNVGIHTTSSPGYALTVTGPANFETLYIRGNDGLTTLNVNGNVYVSNAVTTTNVFATRYYGDGGLLSNISSSAITQPFANLVVSNAVTTTNLFTTTANVGTLNVWQVSNLSTLSLTNNLYAANAVTTANLFTAGITSNAAVTTFNYDTITVPFVSCTTINVSSTSNLQIATITGTIGQTSLNVTGNIYASNAVTATTHYGNVSASNVVVTPATGVTGINVTGNLYASNAVTATNVFAATVSTTNPISFRNRIINGGMSIWQRNTASISTTSGIYTTADRWCGALGTSGLILSQWPGPTEAPQFPYSLQVTTSTTTTGVPLVEQHVENLNIPELLNGTPVTVSFYAGQPYGTLMPLTVGLYYATVVNNFGTQTLAVSATQNTPTLTTANVYYSLSFTLTTSLGATNGLSLRFTTGGASAVGSTVLLTGVQLEKGSIATPFEVRPYATELALCQRYYYQLTSPTAAVQGTSAVYAIFGTATGITSTAFWLPIQFPVSMRNPYYTFSNSAVSNFQLLPTGTTTITSVGVQSDSYTPIGATLNFVGTNIVPTASYIFRTNNLTGSNVAFFGFSCEL